MSPKALIPSPRLPAVCRKERSFTNGRRFGAGLILFGAAILYAHQAEEQQTRRTPLAPEQEMDASSERLPGGAGQTLLLEACVQCHDLRPVTMQRKTAAGWRRTVNEMIWRGAPLMPGEAEVVTGYLTASFGTQAQRAAPRQAVAVSAPDRKGDDNRFLPPGEGRALLLKACLRCHDVRTTVAQRKTREGWRRSVHQMVAIGAPLSGSEVEVLTRYLSDAFGPDDPVPNALKKAAGGN